MKIYLFSPDNGEYLGVGQAQPSPLEPGKYLIPRNSTDIPPHDLDVDRQNVWTGSEWTDVVDHRGKTYWLDGEEQRITTLGETLPAGASWDEPAPTITNASVNDERDIRILKGRHFWIKGVGNICVAGDAQTRENLIALAQAASLRLSQGNPKHVTHYRCEDNVIWDMYPRQVIELWAATTDYMEALYAASWALKDNPSGIPDDYAEDYHWPNQTSLLEKTNTPKAHKGKDRIVK